MSPRRLFLALISFFVLGSLAAAAAESTALQAPYTFKRGVSIGHWMAKMPDIRSYGAPWFGRADILWIAQQGFDHVRYPVDGRLWLRDDGSLDEPRIARFLEAVGWARENHLGAVLDLHFLPGGKYDPNTQDTAIFSDAATRAKAAAFWGQIARRLASEGSWLRFEVINEPFAPRNDQLNSLNRESLAAIRAVDRHRIVYITSNDSSSFATLHDLAVPDDPHVAVVLHYDEPLIFTHQRASWKHLPSDMPEVKFPGRVPDLSKFVPTDSFAAKASLTKLTEAEVDAAFAKAARWLAQNAPGKEVYLGEFGCYEAAPAESRRVYIATVRAAAERHDWGWAVWDYKSSFAVRAPDGRPTAVLAGLFAR